MNVSHFLSVYIATLLLIFTLLLYGAFAWTGLGLAVRRYVAVVAPGATGRLEAASWRGLVFPLFCAAAFYWSMGWTIAAASLSHFPDAVRRSISPWVVALLSFLSILYFLIVVYGARSNYMTFIRVSDFRLWIRGVPRKGLAAAHEYFLTGWRSKAMDSASGLAVAGGFLLFVLLVLIDVHDGVPSDRDRLLGDAAVFLAATTFWLVRGVAIRFWSFLRPEYRLAQLCMGSLPDSGIEYGLLLLDERIYFVHKPGGYRGPRHEVSFEIADLLEASVRRARGRFAQHHYVQLELAVRRLAQSMRLNALKMEEDNTFAADEERKMLCLLLATGRDPLAFVGRVARLTDGEPAPPALPQRRAAKAAEAVSAGINRHWSAIKVVVIVFAIVFLIFSGKIMEAIGLLK